MNKARLPLLKLGLLTIVMGAFLQFWVAPYQPKSAWTATDLEQAKHGLLQVSEATAQPHLEAYGTLPLTFEVNQGQADTRVDFLSRGPEHTLFLTPTELGLSLVLPQSAEKTDQSVSSLFSSPTVFAPRASPESAGLRMKLVGANPHPAKTGLEELPGKVNYFLGKDPSKWRSNIATFAKVKYQDIYPGVDLVYYGNERQLEYDFVVAPKVNPKTIALDFVGADNMEVDAEGDLILQVTGETVLRLQKPLVYQEIDGVKQEIPGGYLVAKHRVSFQIAAYDTARPLVIDPVLVYSTRLGTSSDDSVWAIAADSAGNVYLAGDTNSTDFPLANPLQRASGGSTDIFVAKLNSDGSKLLYSTYIGGSGDEVGYGIALDSAGNIYITGDTSSTNFPLEKPFQSTLGSPESPDIIVAKLSPDGSKLLYSTYIGGNFGERGTGIAVDSSGHACIVGFTNSTNFPTANPFQKNLAAGGGSIQVDAFVLRLDPSGSSLVYSTYLGGGVTPPDRPDFGTAIAVDSAGNAYVTGFTNSADFPSINPFQRFQGPTDVFVTKFDPRGTPVYSTHIGGIADDEAMGIAVDASGCAYVTGETESLNYPTTREAYSRTCVPVATEGAMRTICKGGDLFVTKLSPDGTRLIYSTYINADGFEVGRGIVVDSAGNAYVTGITGSTDFPKVKPLQAAYGGGKFDAFVIKLNPTGTAVTFSTCLGGSGNDGGYGIARDGADNVYVIGYTESPNFPARNSLPRVTGGSRDGFVIKISNKGASR